MKLKKASPKSARNKMGYMDEGGKLERENSYIQT